MAEREGNKVVVVRGQRHTIGGAVLQIGFLLVLIAAGIFGYDALKAGATERLLRDRLESIAEDRRALVELYNDAVRRTAVTELLVEDGTVSILVPRPGDAGEIAPQRIETPFDPSNELFVDYVVVDGRLWIRRVYDDATPPREAVIVSPEIADVDWQGLDRSSEGRPGGPGVDGVLSHGQVIYRGNLTEGRWVISMSGNGALSLRKVDPGDAVLLRARPGVAGFAEIEEQLDREVGRIGFLDIIGSLFGDGGNDRSGAAAPGMG